MNRFLIAHDFSQQSERALLRTLRLAKDDAAVRIFHCTSEEDDPAELAAKRSRLLGEAQIMAEEVGRIFLDITAHVGPGDPADAILREADRFRANLIVIGGHGEPRFRDAVFGTTATHVVRHARRPVLIVQNVGLAAYPHMMIAIADPLDARFLLSSALAVAPSAGITAVHAYSPTLVQTIIGTAELEQQEGRLQRQIEEAFAEAGEATHIEVQVEMGEILDVLMKAYEISKPPLLVMGTRARSTYLGSRAVDTLFWCPGDLLIVPDHVKLADEAAPVGRIAARRS